jgi:hypothetical protein
VNQRELKAYLEEVLGEGWEPAWKEIETYLQLCLWRLRNAAGEPNREPGISKVRFHLDLDYICRLIAEHGCLGQETCLNASPLAIHRRLPPAQCRTSARRPTDR